METNEVLMGIRKICKKSGLTMAEIAVKWILENPAITCTLVGSRNARELEANVKAVQTPLDKEIKARLDSVSLSVMEKLGNHFDYYESAENDRTK